MGRPGDNKKCDAATKKKLKIIQAMCGRDPHNTCSDKGCTVNVDGDQLNAYIHAMKQKRKDVSERFAPNKPYKVCANQERLINLELEEYDIEQNRLEEEYFANRQRYNLRSNGENIIEEEMWVDNRFNAIEEEAIDLPGGNNNNNNNNNPPAIVDHRNLPRTSKFIKLSELVQERSKKYYKRY